MKNINKIADEMRKSLSEYCIKECKSYCCRKGYLIVSEEELNLIVGDEKKKQKLLKEKNIREMLGGKYSINFESCLGCPGLSLKSFKCKIYKNEKRSKTCKEFPIFISGNKIKISGRCPAKRDNKFFKFEKQAKKLGYGIVETLFE